MAPMNTTLMNQEWDPESDPVATIPLYAEAFAMCATLLTLVSYIAGGHICHQLHQKGTSEISNLPLITGLLSTAMWTTFGALKGDRAMIITFGVGFVLFVIYNLFYLARVDGKKPRIIATGELLACAAACALLLLLIYNRPVSHKTMLFVALLSVVMQVAYFASPVASIPAVLRRRSADIMPAPLIFSFVVVALLWTIYGLLRADLGMTFTMAICLLFALTELAVLIGFTLFGNERGKEANYHRGRVLIKGQPAATDAPVYGGGVEPLHHVKIETLQGEGISATRTVEMNR